MDNKKLIDDIKKAISDCYQTSLFDNNLSGIDTLKQACIDFLKFNGYKITNPTEKFKYRVNNIDDLIKLFYLLLDSAHPEYTNVYRNLGRDRKIASTFVKNRMETTGKSKELALEECGRIITTVFKHEKKFNFNVSINFGLFGQDKLSWVSQKAIEIINVSIDETKREQDFKDLERIEREQALEYTSGYDDLDTILARIEEGVNAKEERTN